MTPETIIAVGTVLTQLATQMMALQAAWKKAQSGQEVTPAEWQAAGVDTTNIHDEFQDLKAKGE